MPESSWLVAVVHSSARSEVVFTAKFPNLPPAGTVLSWPDCQADPKFVVVRAYVEIPKGDFPVYREAFVEVREISLGMDFPDMFPVRDNG